mmetsp:Transcript_2431/g.5208  ORF Transcript_2431/g.5208 Transcript_2431/m.5208 type:complete len:361 (-) Transcript_2431:161-1243(-)
MREKCCLPVASPTPEERRSHPRAWLLCCSTRSKDETDNLKASFENAAQDFYDCAESPEELAHFRAGAHNPQQHNQARPVTRLRVELEENPHESRHCGCGDAADFTAVMAVLERAQEEFSKRMQEFSNDISDFAKGCPELEWATPSTARRMLKANIGNDQKAVKMLVQALEHRARDRQLFQTLSCEAPSDMRIIAFDLEEHPVIYMCGLNQKGDLRALRDQILVTFEAACKLASEEGRVVFIFDMHGLKPHLNMDVQVLKDLAGILSTVFAERIARIAVLDFSRAAQTIWWLLKPLLSPETREKFAFVSSQEARRKLKEDFDQATFDKINLTLDVNRDSRLSQEEREIHAKLTALWRPAKA